MSKKSNIRALWVVKHPKTTVAVYLGSALLVFLIGLAILFGMGFVIIQFIKWAWGV